MKKVLIFVISLYQKLFSLDTGKIPKFFGFSKKTCMFYPSCSEYTKQAVIKHGLFTGGYMAILRISRCHPWNTPSVDEVP